jgi:hypothetical protein
MRWAFGAMGVFCFVPVYDLLIRPSGFSLQIPELALLPAWFIVLVAGALGLALIVAAILGLSRQVVVDAKMRELRELGAGAFGLRFRRRTDFRDLGAPIVRRQYRESGPDNFVVQMPRASGKRSIVIETYADEAGANEVARKIAALLASPGLTPASASP